MLRQIGSLRFGFETSAAVLLFFRVSERKACHHEGLPASRIVVSAMVGTEGDSVGKYARISRKFNGFFVYVKRCIFGFAVLWSLFLCAAF